MKKGRNNMTKANDFFKTEEKETEKSLKDMDALEVIKAAAEGIGLILNDPKPNCKKCHGLGYLGRHADSGEPVPCSCIFPKVSVDTEIGETIVPHNRAEKRKMMKMQLSKKNKNRG